ncbi:MAG TPA: APC family permease [Thermoanaerobaculia bacterium]|nr:APC family permease [Thermoanaerobaculia bacterium]
MTTLKRELGLWRGVALNMIDMVGIGPFITIPFILSAMGGARCMAAWLLAGVLAICDGLVTAELAAEMPRAGGSYIFLRESFGRAGKFLSFLFLFQILISAPLSLASGCIGFAQYLEPILPIAGKIPPITATVVCIVIVILLLRRIDAIGKFSVVLWAGVLGTIGVVIASGITHLRLSSFTFWDAPRHDGKLAFAGMGAALIYAVYDYLGYYNIAYLGDEVKEPEKTIPRVIVISILAVAALYILMQACIVSVLPYEVASTSKFVVADYITRLIGPNAAKWVSAMILWTAFASIFSVMLGYSRILFAAARDQNFFSMFARLHATEAYPFVSVIFLGLVTAVLCWLPLKHIIGAIISIRAIIPFMTQIVGAVVLRIREPERPRPFKMWLYPLPAIVALGLWGWVVTSPEKHLRTGALYVLGAGALFFFLREALLQRTAAQARTE